MESAFLVHLTIFSTYDMGTTRYWHELHNFFMIHRHNLLECQNWTKLLGLITEFVLKRTNTIDTLY